MKYTSLCFVAQTCFLFLFFDARWNSFSEFRENAVGLFIQKSW